MVKKYGKTLFKNKTTTGIVTCHSDERWANLDAFYGRASGREYEYVAKPERNEIAYCDACASEGNMTVADISAGTLDFCAACAAQQDIAGAVALP